MLRIVSCNVNGLRSAVTKGLLPWIARTDPDILCLQEVKAQEADLPEALLRPESRHAMYHFAEKKGYSGTALIAKAAPLGAQIGFGNAEFDREGRYVEAEFANATVISAYFPSGSSSPERQAAKFRFLDVFLPHLRALRARGREVILCGDVNIAHREIDLKNWRSNQEFRIPPRGAGVDLRPLREGRVGRRFPPARSAPRAVHVVEQPGPRVGEKRRVAHRLPDRHRRHCGDRTTGRDIQGRTLQRPRAADHRLRLRAVTPRRGIPLRNAPMNPV